MLRRSLSLLILTLLPILAYGYEVDQFTRRDEVPNDSTAILDTEINRRLQSAIDKANAGFVGTAIGRKHCNSDQEDARQQARFKLFDNLVDQLSTDHPVGVIESFANQSKDVKKRKISMDESIYAEAKEEFAILKHYGITSVLSVNGNQIGADKLGHFLSQGYSIYLQNRKRLNDEESIDAGIKDSTSAEKSYYGLSKTGVVSYADMAANNDGYLFWKKLCGFPRKKDAKTKEVCEKDAFIICQSNGRWGLNPEQKFTLKDYVTPAWDETINCNSFHPSIAEKVQKSMSQRVYLFKGNPKQPCPAEPQKCVEITERYRGSAKKAINPICKKISSNIKTKKETDPKARFDYTHYFYESDKGAYQPIQIKSEEPKRSQ